MKVHCFSTKVSNKMIYFSRKKATILQDTVTIQFSHNVRSLSKHADDILNHDRIQQNDIIGFI